MSAMPARDYYNRNHSGGGGHFPKKTGIGLFILLVLFMTGIPQKIYYEYKAYRGEEIVNYLNVSREYMLFSYEKMIPLIEQIENAPANEVYDLQVKHIEYKHSILNAKPPRHFETYHDALLEVVIRDENILKELLNVKKGNINAYNALIELNNKAKNSMWYEFKQSLTANDIPYVELDNGWIEYEVTVTNPSKHYKYEKDKEDFYERWERVDN